MTGVPASAISPPQLGSGRSLKRGHMHSLGSVRKEGEGGRDVEIVATMTNLPALCESELE